MLQEDGVKSLRTSAIRGAALVVAAFVIFTTYGQAQTITAPGDTASAVRDLQDQVRQLRELVEQMRAENAQSRAEMQKLRQDLQATQALLEQPARAAGNGAQAVAESSPTNESVQATTSTAQGGGALEDRVQKLEETTSLIGSKIDEQYQTKVETASKYRARLHGIVLMNAFRNVGGSDNLDFPDYAQPVAPGSPLASVGATLRQSEIGLEIFGPTVAGARTSADVQFDFAGGFPATGNGVNFGIVRLQTASLRFDWDQTSVVAGQDSLFISPLSPTSFTSLATPAFAFAGNLWGWTPQLRLEHRFSVSDQQTITVQGGVLDNLDWEYNYNAFLRTPQAGEMSGQPAYAFRTAWSRPVEEHPLSFGFAGYYGRQDWTWNRFVDAWSGMADWQIPIVSRLSLSGEFYRGRGIGGLGAAIGTSIVYGGNPSYPYTPIRGLDTAGGWTQLKFQLTPKIELNGGVAQDDAFTSDIRGFATDQNNGGTMGAILGRNRGALGNIVFRPRSDLVLSAELRRLRTFPVYDFSSTTNQVNLSMGILF
jgi:Skp family chaperone for outer membrane proteins